MTTRDEIFIKACELADSIVAGDYHLPQEMTYTINRLHDAVMKHMYTTHTKLSDCLSQDYIQVKEYARKEREDHVKGLKK